MVTSEGYQGKGVSSALMDFVADWSRNNGARMILLSTYGSNDQAIAFYKKKGFKQYGCLPDGIPHGGKYEDEIFLCLVLE